MKLRVGTIAALLIAAVIGWVFRDSPYRLDRVKQPADQAALEHRDSPYSHVTWVISPGDNYAELRFFDKVEGGVCLRPRWDELADIDGKLEHLAMPADYPFQQPPAGKTWPHDWKPNPGTLPHTRYVCLYPLATLLTQRLMREAGGDPRRAAPKVLVVGLGSGVGLSVLAHHFPNASMTTVDIDQVVIDMVRDHYPMLRWLEQQKTSDGQHRLKMVRRDARQYIAIDELRDDDEGPYDIVVLDAYTSGSTIPPHLMTRESFAEVADVMSDDGILLANIIGSYSGGKRKVLGGAMRSMRAAGLEHVHNFPIVYEHVDNQKQLEHDYERNNVVLASRSPLDPDGNRAGWQAVDRFLQSGEPYAELPNNRFLSARLMLVRSTPQGTSAYAMLPAQPQADEPLADLARSLLQRWKSEGRPGAWLKIDDRALAQRARQAVLADHQQRGLPPPAGWAELQDADRLFFERIDWVDHARRVFRNSVEIARLPAGIGRFAHQGIMLVGPEDEQRRAELADDPTWIIDDAPLFTDARPNADILNH